MKTQTTFIMTTEMYCLFLLA